MPGSGEGSSNSRIRHTIIGEISDNIIDLTKNHDGSHSFNFERKEERHFGNGSGDHNQNYDIVLKENLASITFSSRQVEFIAKRIYERCPKALTPGILLDIARLG